MSFTPQFSAFFASALAEQAMAIIQRDFPPAIAAITPPVGRAYATFGAYKKALDNTPINPPEAIVAVRSTAFSKDDNGRYRGEAHRLMIRPFLADQDPSFAAQAAYDYIRALDQVLTSAMMGPDWAEPLALSHPTRPEGYVTPGLASIGGHVLDVWIESHDYGVLWTGPQGFGVMPTITAVIEVVEV